MSGKLAERWMSLPSRVASRLGIGGLSLFLMASGCDDRIPSSTHAPQWVEEISSLTVARSGRLSVLSLYPGRRNQEDNSERLTYVISAFQDRVEDTEIRGFLDGTVKHHYNQGTAYHMRVGRRYSGALGGEYELKRALLR